MKKNLLMILIALMVGFFLGNYFLKQYDGLSSLAVFDKNSIMYFIEYGKFTSQEEMDQQTIELENYIYELENNEYHVYIGIIKNKELISKIKSYFDHKGYNVTIKNFNISNSYFNDIIDNYDAILATTNDDIVISSVLSQGLQTYEEVINKSGNN